MLLLDTVTKQNNQVVIWIKGKQWVALKVMNENRNEATHDDFVA
jgi:hypothetical protein